MYFPLIQYVVMPTRRSTAEAFQILISHTFGDAGSPYLIGLISDTLKAAIQTAHNSSMDISSGEIHSLARRETNATDGDNKVSIENYAQLAKHQLITINN